MNHKESMNFDVHFSIAKRGNRSRFFPLVAHRNSLLTFLRPNPSNPADIIIALQLIMAVSFPRKRPNVIFGSKAKNLGEE